MYISWKIVITVRCTYFDTTTQGVSSHSEGLVHKVPTLYQLRQEAHHLITSEEPGRGRSTEERERHGGERRVREERGKGGMREGGNEGGRERGRKELAKKRRDKERGKLFPRI